MWRHSMMKILFLISLLVSPLAFSAITDPTKTIMTSEEKSLFTITLASNPSTGFTWLLESYDATLLKLVKHEYLASSIPIKGKVGTSGVENWTFTANTKVSGPQVTKITLINARPWDVNNTTREKTTFTVVVN